MAKGDFAYEKNSCKFYKNVYVHIFSYVLFFQCKKLRLFYVYLKKLCKHKSGMNFLIFFITNTGEVQGLKDSSIWPLSNCSWTRSFKTFNFSKEIGHCSTQTRFSVVHFNRIIIFTSSGH